MTLMELAKVLTMDTGKVLNLEPLRRLLCEPVDYEKLVSELRARVHVHQE